MPPATRPCALGKPPCHVSHRDLPWRTLATDRPPPRQNNAVLAVGRSIVPVASTTSRSTRPPGGSAGRWKDPDRPATQGSAALICDSRRVGPAWAPLKSTARAGQSRCRGGSSRGRSAHRSRRRRPEGKITAPLCPGNLGQALEAFWRTVHEGGRLAQRRSGRRVPTSRRGTSGLADPARGRVLTGADTLTPRRTRRTAANSSRDGPAAGLEGGHRVQRAVGRIWTMADQEAGSRSANVDGVADGSFAGGV